MVRVALKQNQVLQPIIIVDSIYVMNNLPTDQVASKMFLHHKAMFPHIHLLAIILSIGLGSSAFIQCYATWVFWAVNPHITLWIDCASSTPFRMTQPRPRSRTLAFNSKSLACLGHNLRAHGPTKPLAHYPGKPPLSATIGDPFSQFLNGPFDAVPIRHTC